MNASTADELEQLGPIIARHRGATGLDRGMSTADDLTAVELEQLAQSLAIDGSLGWVVDVSRVVDVSPALAAARRGSFSPNSMPSLLTLSDAWPSDDRAVRR